MVAGVDLRGEIGRHRPGGSWRAEEGQTPTWATAQEAVAGIVAWLGADDAAPSAGANTGTAGLGPLAGLVRDTAVQDILVVGSDRIFAEVRGRLERQPLAFDDDEAVIALAQRLAAPIGRELTVVQPYVDARLDGLGLRMTATLPPFSRRPTLSLRKTRALTASRTELLALRTANAAVLDFLATAVRCRLNILLFGPTGAGKTTIARFLARHVPDTERIVTIEETLELGLSEIHPHVVELETRDGARSAAAAPVDMDQALRQALHMRPDRILVGEVRHREALTLVMALSTGHGGAWTTLHAKGPEEVFDRLAFAMLLGAPQVDVASLKRLAVESVDLVVGMQRDGQGGRRIGSVSEVVGLVRARAQLRTLFAWDGHEAWTAPDAPTPRLAERLAAGGLA